MFTFKRNQSVHSKNEPKPESPDIKARQRAFSDSPPPNHKLKRFFQEINLSSEDSYRLKIDDTEFYDIVDAGCSLRDYKPKDTPVLEAPEQEEKPTLK